MNRIHRIVEETVGPTVLDLGAAQHEPAKADNDDWLHKHLCDSFERVIGVDYLPDAVAELNRQGYEFVQADVTDMSLSVAADTVVAGELIEHVDNPGRMLDCIADHLKPGGRVVLSTPNPWGLSLLRRFHSGDTSVNDEHVAWYGPTVLRQLFERHGFEIERIDSVRCTTDRLTRLAQLAGADMLAGTTWVAVATYAP